MARWERVRWANLSEARVEPLLEVARRGRRRAHLLLREVSDDTHHLCKIENRLGGGVYSENMGSVRSGQYVE